ncbi:hypothetical protein [Candidatus Harpocratesius sp.]
MTEKNRSSLLLKQESHQDVKKSLSLVNVIFIALMSATNVGIDLLLSPSFILLFSHIIAGVLIMLPINFLFISLTKYLIDDRFGSLTLYMIIFGTIAAPTTFFGSVPGIYKIVVGIIIGIILDAVYLIKIQIIRPIIVGILGSTIWWLSTFTIWTLFQFPYVMGFSNLFNAFWNISSFVSIPVMEISWNLVKFSLVCGITSSLPTIIMCYISWGLFLSVKKTAIYARFSQM